MAELEEKFKELVKTVQDYSPNADFNLMKRAWEFAKLAHGDSKRLSGEPYISHVLKVAQHLADWRLDTSTITAGLLHDTIFAGAAKKEDLTEFGQDVVSLIDGVTQIDNLHLGENKEEKFVENLRKLILFIARDVRVILLRLSDRLENMKTLWALPQEDQSQKAHETLEIYAPLAERLGIGAIKGELEDLAFPYLHPKEHKKLIEEAKPYFKKAEGRINIMKKRLLKLLAKESIRARIQGRKKHLWSLWKKLSRPEVSGDFSKIYDIIALRIFVDTIPDCYTALGVVHSAYKPVPYLGISDFIAQPKPNGYRSIHTRVFGPQAEIFEVQIRTHKMHEEAEYGIAAHWAYSEKKAKGAGGEVLEKGVFVPQDKLSWMRQLVDWQKNISDSEEFLKAVRFDALADRIFVFSPKGDVFDLPSGSTALDFAYAVHTKIGDRAQGCKVDGRLVPLNYKLASGQVVEILTGKNQHPNSRWLSFVVTSLARRRINNYLRKQR